MTIPFKGAFRLPSRLTSTRTLASLTRSALIVCAMALTPMGAMVAQRASVRRAGVRRPTAAATSSPAGSCLDTTATITPARLDDRHLIYVEQETVVPNRDGRILVAGAPVFVWRNAGDRYDLLGLDSLFGMIVEPRSSVVRAIPSPLPGRVLKGMRAAALPDGWWLVTFAEVFSVQKPQPANVIAMWAGETNGARWRAVEKLPAVSDTLAPLYFSGLAERDGRVRLAAVSRRDWRRRVVLFSRDRGRWTVQPYELGLATLVAVTATPSFDLLAVVRPDTTIIGVEDHNSLFLYSKSPTDTAWTSHPRLWLGGRDPAVDAAHQPTFAGGATRPVLLWSTGPILRSGRVLALSLPTIPDSAVTPISISGYVSDLVASSIGEAGVIATYDRGSPTRDIRVFEYHEPFRVSRVIAKASEYRGLFGAALTSDRLVLVTSKAGQTPRDAGVISMLETYAWRCR